MVYKFISFFKTIPSNEQRSFNSIKYDNFGSWLIVDSYFVYYVQPLNPSLDNFILHIVPSNGGKGNNTVVSFESDGNTFAAPSNTNNIQVPYNKYKF